MDIDLELYRHEVRVSEEPLIRLSAIDIHPEHAQHTIIFLHGYGGMATQWQYQLQEFSVKNRVIGIDLRGHALSDKPNSKYSMEELQADLTTVLKKLGVTKKIVLVGHSFGGAIASEFTARHPEKVEKLVLIATTGEFELNVVYRMLLKLPYWLHGFIAPFTRKWLGAPPSVMKAWSDNNLSKWNGWSFFRDITTPTLVLRGHRDRVFAKQHFKEVAQTIPGAEEINVGSSGHMVMLERREVVNRAIKEFLEETHRSWRDKDISQSKSVREKLIEARHWLVHYDSGVPYTISSPNIPVHHLLRSAVRRFPGRAAAVFEGNKLSFRQLNWEVNKFANALRSLGIDKGDRVLLLMPNIPQMIIAYFGVMKAGGVAVFTLPVIEEDEILRQIHDSGAKAVVTINQFGEVGRRGLSETQLEHVIFTNVGDYLPAIKQAGISLDGTKRAEYQLPFELEEGMQSYKQMMKGRSRQSPKLHIDPNELAVIIYTGGTTADAKGVMLSHRNLVTNALQLRHWIPDAKAGKETFLCVIPFSHSYGLTAVLNVGISVGATLILKATFEVEDTLNAIKHYKPTIFHGVPQMYLNLSAFPGVRKYGIESIRACISGSSPLPVEAQEEFEKLTRGRVVEGYGLTEASPGTHANPLYGQRKVGSIGIPLPSTDAKIVSLSDPTKKVPNGQIGELAVSGPQIMMGYWNNAAATKKVVMDDNWLLTGDVAQADEQGYFRIIARKSELWYPDKPGMPAFPRDVEEVLYEVPQVKEVVVVAIAKQPIAFV
ncbi:MAG: alpha/beta fold hydrolase, partial [Chloroflexota bacterium]